MGGFQEAARAEDMMREEVARARERVGKLQEKVRGIRAQQQQLHSDLGKALTDLQGALVHLGESQGQLAAMTEPRGYGGAPTMPERRQTDADTLKQWVTLASRVPGTEYVTVKIPKAVADKFPPKRLERDGFRTFSEFVIHVVRREAEGRP